MTGEQRSSADRASGFMALGIAVVVFGGIGVAGNYAQNYYRDEAADVETDIEKALRVQFPNAHSIEADVTASEAFWNGNSPMLISAGVSIEPAEGSCAIEFSTHNPGSTEPQIILYYPEIEGDTADGWKAITNLHREERFVLPNGEVLDVYPDNRPTLAGEPKSIVVDVARMITAEDLDVIMDANC